MSGSRLDDLPVKAVLVAREGRYFFYEPGVGVIGSDENIEAAYKKFDGAWREYMAQAKQAGLANVGSASAGPVTLTRNVRQELMLFVGKFCIVLAVVTLLALPAVLGITRSIDQAAAGISGALGSAGSISLADIVRKAEAIVQDARDLPDEKKASLRQSIGTISRELEPFVDAWRNPPETPSSPQK